MGRPNVALRQIERPSSRLTIALVVAALLIVGMASLYMVQMPGAFSTMLVSMWPF
jgi:hypothetical protein